MLAQLPPTATRTAYRAQQTAFLLNCLAAHRVLRTVTGMTIEPSAEALELVRKRYDELLERDLENVERGIYPRSLLFQVPLTAYAKRFPRLVSDFPRTIRRLKAKNFKDLPEDARLEDYPPYFRRNFHWQTDGYFSQRSAELYDVGVEFLFLGTADIMRRQVIPPIVERAAERAESQRLRVLDVACGTGRTLRQIAATLPDAKLFGLDLSPYYLSKARRLLAKASVDASFIADNAERMPLRDDYFDVSISVYLFHELPKRARQNVLREMFRVTKPGGLVVVEDSAQYAEAGPIAFFLERFSQEFHEPYHREYLNDDLVEQLAEAGFEVVRSEPCFVSKLVVGRKPAR
ncbi:MAG: methyltransferase domain-containing protein [Polyangiaceae bacterium]